MDVIITKVPMGMVARCPRTKLSGAGLTWMEALGSLVSQAPELFGVDAVRYNQVSELTREYMMRHELDPVISSASANGNTTNQA